MAYKRNSKWIMTAADKAKRAERMANDPYSNDTIYQNADRKFSLAWKNVRDTADYWNHYYSVGQVKDFVRQLEKDIINRRFQMFATHMFQRTHVWTEGVAVSGDHTERRAWLYYHEAELKFARKVCERLYINL